MTRYYTIFLGALSMAISLQSCKNNSGKEPTSQEIKESANAQSEVQGKEINYSSDSTQMKGYIAYDGTIKGKRPGIIVVHEWWGHNEYSRKRADMLAELGYVALAVDMYGDGKQAFHPDDAGKFSGKLMRDIELAKVRFDAAVAALKSNPGVDPEKISAIGYCFGGGVVLTMANMGADLDAVAAFHSGVQLPVMPNDRLKATVLVCNGAVDPFISPESVETYKTAMDSVKANYKYITYPGAQHAFTNKSADSLGKKFKLPLAYQEEADGKSWAELLSLLERTYPKENR